MANDLTEIVSVSVTVESNFPTRLGFGTPVIMTYHDKFAESNRTYASLQEMVADGFTSADEAYRMALKLFSQNPSPASVVVGRMDSLAVFQSAKVEITSAVEGEVVSLSVVEPFTGVVVPVTYTIPAAATTTTVATAVALLIGAVAGVNATGVAAVVECTLDGLNAHLMMFSPQNCTVEHDSSTSDYDLALSALRDDNDDWYMVLIGSMQYQDIIPVAAWAEANDKLFFYQRNDTSVLDVDDPAGVQLRDAEYKRTAGIYHSLPLERADAAWVGVIAPQDPGTITASLKSLSGITADSLSSTAKNNLQDTNVNYYISKRGRGITQTGVVASGEWIDVVHGIDALTSRVQEDVFGLLATSGKVPYTDSGINMVANVTGAAVRFFEGSRESPGLLIPNTTVVTVPARSSIAPADVSSRILRNVRFTAKLSGAIHAVVIQGTVGY